MSERPSAPDAYAHLDAEVERLRPLWEELLDAVRDAVAEHLDAGGPLRVVDLGAGTGVATLGLARRLPGATVTAVESGPARLEQVAAQAGRLGLGARVETVRADLEDPWPGSLTDLDVVWASMSLHHLADPVRVLADALAATRTGGLLALVELPPGSHGNQGKHGHGHDGHGLPHRGASWTELVRAAGWEPLAERTFTPAAAPDSRGDEPRVLTLARRTAPPAP